MTNEQVINFKLALKTYLNTDKNIKAMFESHQAGIDLLGMLRDHGDDIINALEIY
jgi:hypothetical protein